MLNTLYTILFKEIDYQLKVIKHLTYFVFFV